MSSKGLEVGDFFLAKGSEERWPSLLSHITYLKKKSML